MVGCLYTSYRKKVLLPFRDKRMERALIRQQGFGVWPEQLHLPGRGRRQNSDRRSRVTGLDEQLM